MKISMGDEAAQISALALSDCREVCCQLRYAHFTLESNKTVLCYKMNGVRRLGSEDLSRLHKVTLW